MFSNEENYSDFQWLSKESRLEPEGCFCCLLANCLQSNWKFCFNRLGDLQSGWKWLLPKPASSQPLFLVLSRFKNKDLYLPNAKAKQLHCLTCRSWTASHQRCENDATPWESHHWGVRLSPLYFTCLVSTSTARPYRRASLSSPMKFFIVKGLLCTLQHPISLF